MTAASSSTSSMSPDARLPRWRRDQLGGRPVVRHGRGLRLAGAVKPRLGKEVVPKVDAAAHDRRQLVSLARLALSVIVLSSIGFALLGFSVLASHLHAALDDRR